MGASNRRERVAKIIVSHTRAQGHPYIELRKDGKAFIYFCVLCHARCFGDIDLYDHLGGKIHSLRLVYARLTLMKPNPWPFNDGLIFFYDNLAKSDTLDDGSTLMIPRLRIGNETMEIKFRKVGLGKISARFVQKYGSSNGNEIRRIWCEWLGKEIYQDDIEVQDHDFAVVIFPYNYDLGMNSVPDDVGKRKSICLSNAPSTSTHNQSNSPLLRRSFVSIRDDRKAIRRRECLSAKKVCNLCHQKMVFGKDVAAFLNMKSGRVVCCGRNPTGVFHVFHTACVIHWILWCEYQIITNHSVNQSASREGKKKFVAGCGKEDKDIKHVFCPECHGAGLINPDGLEKFRKISSSQIFRLKLKMAQQYKEWIRSPEDMQNCSIGFHFPLKSEKIAEEKVEAIKILHFYRADDERVVNKNCVNVA